MITSFNTLRETIKFIRAAGRKVERNGETFYFSPVGEVEHFRTALAEKGYHAVSDERDGEGYVYKR